MNFQTTTTHVVIKFNEKTKNGKESIDILPISWTYYKKGKLFSRYPYEDEYHKLDDMCKLSVEPKTFWKSYEATLIKEAKSYEQGLRRMNRACSETIVHSSNLDERNSSEEEMNPLK
ncbi:unnamed protein product [Macrosiphum euphorbiae]|uniref:Uncharacterized protein n=1 Tax=Macrosiphum euphorbiae TaxID=13131 RepID=A0AAV0XTT0_9HEMI|nr:unnamed protein product [Macrosiphum euphorbiae]